MNDWKMADGYRFAGVHSGLRPDPDRLDLAVVISDRPAAAAGVFTQNKVCAAPVQVCKERLPRGDARGIVICSGNANACTGEQGLADARQMTATLARSLGCQAEQVLVCSTGVIGRLLPMAVIDPGIDLAAKNTGVGPEFLERAARAILTTDTGIKVATRSLTIDGQEIRLTGFAKGAAMIGPNMATMLAFVLTDAAVRPADLASIAKRATEHSFNCVSVEGHTSTNDTLLFLANGTGPALTGANLAKFTEAGVAVCMDLAQAIGRDAEGATKFVTLDIDGLRTEAECRLVAKAVAESALVKTAFFGADPNWGRIVSAAGYSGVEFQERDLSLWLGDFLLYDRGKPLPFDPAAASAYIKSNRELHVRLKFTIGSAKLTFWTCDLTYDYVRLNADYTT